MAALLPENIISSSLGCSLVDSFCGRKQRDAVSGPAFSVQAMGRRILEGQQKQLMLAAPAEKQPIKLYSSEYVNISCCSQCLWGPDRGFVQLLLDVRPGRDPGL